MRHKRPRRPRQRPPNRALPAGGENEEQTEPQIFRRRRRALSVSAEDDERAVGDVLKGKRLAVVGLCNVERRTVVADRYRKSINANLGYCSSNLSHFRQSRLCMSNLNHRTFREDQTRLASPCAFCNGHPIHSPPLYNGKRCRTAIRRTVCQNNWAPIQLPNFPIRRPNVYRCGSRGGHLLNHLTFIGYDQRFLLPFIRPFNIKTQHGTISRVGEF